MQPPADDESAIAGRRWKSAIEHASDGIMLLSEDGHILDANGRFAELVGRSLEQCRGVHFSELLDPADVPRLLGEFDALLRKGSSRVVPLRMRRLDGVELTLDASAVLVPAETGTLAFVIVRDIEEQARRERSLRHREAQFRGLFFATPDAVLLVSSDGRITLANPAADRLFGYAVGELAGRSIDDLVPEAAREHHRMHMAAYLESPQPRPMGTGLDLRGRRRDGSLFAMDLMLGPVAVDEELLTLCMVRDVSEQRRAQEELRQARNRLEQAVAAGRVGLCDWDLVADVVDCSPEWKRQLGYGQDEIADPFRFWRSRLHPEDRQAALEAVQAALSGAMPVYESTYRLRHRDGSYRHIMAQGTVELDAAARPLRMVAAHIDVTERVHLQADLAQAQRMESVGRLAGGIAHDFNNLLTVILGCTDLIAESDRLPEALRGDLEDVRTAARSAAALTKQLLAFSRRQPIAPVLLDLNRAVEAIGGMLQRLIGEDVDLVFRFSPVKHVRLDPVQVEQLLMNLSANARDAMPTGGTLTIATSMRTLGDSPSGARRDLRPGEYVVLAVSDTGVGMDPSVLEHVFEPFFTTKALGHGTGLGLATVYGIIKQNHGDVWVDSEPGRGTTFTLYFPAAAGGEDAPVDAGEARAGTETVLLVEDEPGVRRLTERGLHRLGYSVITAASGAEALERAAAMDVPIAVLITDVVMPGMDGPTLARELTRTHPAIRVVYCSGYPASTIARYGVISNGAVILEKPYTVDTLARKLRAIVDGPPS